MSAIVDTLISVLFLEHWLKGGRIDLFIAFGSWFVGEGLRL